MSLFIIIALALGWAIHAWAAHYVIRTLREELIKYTPPF